MQRVVVSVSNDLVTDQRVAKVCQTLADANYDLYLIGRQNSKSLEVQASYQTSRLKVPFSRGFLFYASFNIQLFFTLLFKKKDILLANDLDTLLANFLVSRLQRKPLVFDSHELFSEVPELVGKPLTKAFWRFLEARIIPRIRHAYTVSDSIAKYYQDTYGVRFAVIRNVPTLVQDQSTKCPLELPKNKNVILYQGAINIGRGLELMIEAMTHLNQVLLVLVGEGDISNELKDRVKSLALQDKVLFYNKLRPNVLKLLSPQADIGISLEEDMGLNYRYALPNKLFDYIHAKIPVVVSDLPEMKQLVEEYQVGEVLINRTPVELANVVANLLDKGKAHYKEPLDHAARELNWESESRLLTQLFRTIS